jgi:hypothetical protein
VTRITTFRFVGCGPERLARIRRRTVGRIARKPKEPNMTRTSRLAIVAIATAATSALMPASASAFGFRPAAPARVVVTSHLGHAPGWGYGRGWCYWHPYVCYYR